MIHPAHLAQVHLKPVFNVPQGTIGHLVHHQVHLALRHALVRCNLKSLENDSSCLQYETASGSQNICGVCKLMHGLNSPNDAACGGSNPNLFKVTISACDASCDSG